MKYAKKLVLFTLFAMNLVDQPTPPVTIEQGTLVGKVSADGSFFEYIGIPYATANSSNRFQAPYPPPRWSGVYRATDEIHWCPQALPVLGVLGEEDCLKLNVFAPVVGERRAVLVYVHGGAFQLGGGGRLLYGPEFLVARGVVLVTINYRLGALGFLCLHTKEAPGNAALRDMIAALRWVQRNIAAFGGDPDNVTIFGESAGATAISLLIASEATDGLFHRAIQQSGSALSSWVINRKPVWVASLLAKSLGYDTEDPRELADIFSRMDYRELVAAKTKKPLDKYFDTQLLHIPCVEKSIPGVEPVVADLPYDLLKRSSKNISIINGFNSREGLFLTAGDSPKSIDERNGRYLFASDLEFPSESEADAVAETVKEFFFGSGPLTMDKIMNVSKFYTDIYFEFPSLLETETLLRDNKKAKVYNYYFNYSGGRNFMKQRAGYGNESGACHGDDILYLFKADLWPFPVNARDQIIINWMTKMWTDFAKYGEPTPAGEGEVPVRWAPSAAQELQLLYIDEAPRMGAVPNPRSYQLLKQIYQKYRRKQYN